MLAKGSKSVESKTRKEEKGKEKEGIEEFDTDEDEPESNSNDGAASEASDYTKHLVYEGNSCIYVEPGTGRKLIWDSEKNEWVPKVDSLGRTETETKTEGENQQSTKDYALDGKNDGYTDDASNVTYKFDRGKNKGVVEGEDGREEDVESAEDARPPAVGAPTPGGIYGFENDTHTYTDPTDGSAYFWDREKNAWFPKVDEDFMARYQMSYGFVDPNAVTSVSVEKTASESKIPHPAKDDKVDKEQKKAEMKRKAQEPPTWFHIDEAHNTAIYASGLPLDVTLEELTELFNKCGLIARDEKGKDKIKIYKDADGEPKGDALCTYIKVESVELALKILDGWQIRGKTISVQRAKFQLKGAYDPALKPKRKKKDKERLKKIREKLFDWRPERMRGEPLKCERVVIIKNLFTPEDFDKEVTLLLEYQQDIRSECQKCGDVRKVVVYDRHPEGVAQVTFKEPEEAQACVQLLNGRWFGKRKITAEIWDGKTKYKIHETDAEIEERLNKWDKYLEEEDERKEKAAEKQEKSKREAETE